MLWPAGGPAGGGAKGTKGTQVQSGTQLCGPNLAAVSDGVAWGPRFHSSCGRLLPFLIQFGSKSGPDCVNGFTI